MSPPTAPTRATPLTKVEGPEAIEEDISSGEPIVGGIYMDEDACEYVELSKVELSVSGRLTMPTVRRSRVRAPR